MRKREMGNEPYMHRDADLVNFTESFKNKGLPFSVGVGDFGYTFSDPKTGIEIKPQDRVVDINFVEPNEEEISRPLSMVKEFLEELYISLEMLPPEKRPKFIASMTHEQIGKISETLGFHFSPFEPNAEHLAAIEENYEKTQAYTEGKALQPVLVYLPTEQFLSQMELK